MFTVTDHGFERDGAAHRIVSGALHYFRVHPALWADRLRRLRTLGANTVETYVAWNFHAPAPGRAEIDGPRDLGAFLDAAAAADLDVIVRPGPYICAEWEGGGLPGWLLADPRLRLRCSDPAYLAAVDAWFDVLIPIVAARQYPEGGRVVAVQVENEYGSYGDDRAHLEHLRDGLLRRGIHVPLMTSDGPTLQYLLGGTVAGATPTINFGSRAVEYLAAFRAEYPDTPALCMEFWNGWFDHWGEPHHTRPAADAAAELAAMLDHGMDVNLYMAHGGTNSGLWNGCNHDGVLRPTVTSYDYDAAIAEDGTLTAKFHAFREVIARHLPIPEIPDDLVAEPAPAPATELSEVARGTLTFDDLVSLARATLGAVPGLRLPEGPSPFPPSFEDLGLERGLLLLRARVDHPGGSVPLRLYGLRDRAHVFVDGRLVGIAERDEGTPDALDITAERGELVLDLVVESLGRINFGPLLGERKGVLRGAWFGTRFVMGWEAWPLALDRIGTSVAALAIREQDADGLAVARYALDNTAGRDVFLDLRAHTRGFAWVGDELVGRYWRRGPQQTLYVPAPLVTQDIEVTLLATDGPGGGLRTAPGPILDELLDKETP